MTSPRRVLAVYRGFHDESACLLRDGRIEVAILRERLTRLKHHGPGHDRLLGGRFWRGGLEDLERYCLEAAGVSRDEVQVFEGARAGRHHLYHAYSAFIPSPFDEAAILVVDGMGDRRDLIERLPASDPRGRECECQTVCVGRGSEVTVIDREYTGPPVVSGSVQYGEDARGVRGLGMLYCNVTQRIFGLLHPSLHLSFWEGKTMGLAPYGKPDPERYPMIRLRDGGRIDYLTDWIERVPFEVGAWSDHFQEAADLAATVQQALEDGLLHVARWVHERTGLKKLCLAGGVALNGVANHRLLREGPFDELFIPSYCNDAGQSIGMAFYAWLQAGGVRDRSYVVDHDYFGRVYSEAEMERAIGEAPELALRRVDDPDALCREVARAIAEGKVVGWFQGGSEYGPRALGHRSILADPRRADMRDILNKKVKAREPFRPLAPSVLEEDAGRYFELDRPSPFMLLVGPVRPEARELLPAITHVDGSARPQTVPRREGELYRRLLEALKAEIGMGVVLNTSFNRQGAIVETPRDAVEVFVDTKMDLLCMGPFLAERVPEAARPPLESLTPRLSPYLFISAPYEVPTDAGLVRGRAEAHVGIRQDRIRLSDGALELLLRCDGQRTVAEIAASLSADGLDREAVLAFMEQLRSQGVLRLIRPR